MKPLRPWSAVLSSGTAAVAAAALNRHQLNGEQAFQGARGGGEPPRRAASPLRCLPRHVLLEPPSLFLSQPACSLIPLQPGWSIELSIAILDKSWGLLSSRPQHGPSLRRKDCQPPLHLSLALMTPAWLVWPWEPLPPVSFVPLVPRRSGQALSRPEGKVMRRRKRDPRVCIRGES